MSTLLTKVGRLWSAGEPAAEAVDVLLADGLIQALGPTGSLIPSDEPEVYDCGGALLTAGLIDAHTHPLYLRPRLAEVAARARGSTYAEIAAQGGGIGATVRDTRGASWAELEMGLKSRLRGWLLGGSTTVEAKTGYWLTREGELGAVELLHRLSEQPRLPHLVVTLLGAHALPPEFAGRRGEFVEEVAGWAGAARRHGARFADAFCDQGAFTLGESERLLGSARAAGLGLRLHADELALTGGTRLAVRLGATSADHLLQIGEAEIAVLAGSSTVATLCPVTALSMGRRPPAREMLAAGVSLALGSDHNPGTSGATTMALIVWLAINELGLSVEQALTAATLGGARSLALADRGQVAPGLLGDLVLWDAEHEGTFAWNPATAPRQVWRQGRGVLEASPG
ncbi:MAG: imidazolonepropionase [Candidatus Dormibacteria bacterium]